VSLIKTPGTSVKVRALTDQRFWNCARRCLLVARMEKAKIVTYKSKSIPVCVEFIQCCWRDPVRRFRRLVFLSNILTDSLVEAFSIFVSNSQDIYSSKSVTRTVVSIIFQYLGLAVTLTALTKYDTAELKKFENRELLNL
jgi:hypothetical protein